jgi:hypothetical protein
VAIMAAMIKTFTALRPALALAAIALAGCGSSSASTSHSASAAQSITSTTAGKAASSSTNAGVGALSAEVKATATGDIPDTQQYLTYRNRGLGYQLVYPEGWAQSGSGQRVTFQDKNNLIRVVVSHGRAPSSSAVTAQLAAERKRIPSLSYGAATQLPIGGATVVKISYSTISAPNPVTGKRIELLVDRYVYAHGGKVAILDLATPKGVDNVDAYRRISRSWQWR